MRRNIDETDESSVVERANRGSPECIISRQIRRRFRERLSQQNREECMKVEEAK